MPREKGTTPWCTLKSLPNYLQHAFLAFPKLSSLARWVESLVRPSCAPLPVLLQITKNALPILPTSQTLVIFQSPATWAPPPWDFCGQISSLPNPCRGLPLPGMLVLHKTQSSHLLGLCFSKWTSWTSWFSPEMGISISTSSSPPFSFIIFFKYLIFDMFLTFFWLINGLYHHKTVSYMKAVFFFCLLLYPMS